MNVNKSNGNARVQYDGDGLHISIPSKKSIFSIAFLTFWLAMWFIGEITVASRLLYGGIDSFHAVWITLWTIGGLRAILTLLWMVFGKEVIWSDETYLTIEKRILFFKFKKRYELDGIKDMRVVEVDNSVKRSRRGYTYNGLSSEKIHFDYGMKTIKFGNNIDAAEAKYLVKDVLSKATY